MDARSQERPGSGPRFLSLMMLGMGLVVAILPPARGLRSGRVGLHLTRETSGESVMHVICINSRGRGLIAATSAWAQAPSRVESPREAPGPAPPKADSDVVSLFRFEPTGLSLIRPCRPGKIPVVLIHGLWSNPWSWARMIGELEADATLRDRYQFWTFGYSTGDPIPYWPRCCGATWMRCGTSSTPIARMRPSTGWSSSATAWAVC